MARYRIEISHTAEKQLTKLPQIDQKRVANSILALADDPFPKRSRKLRGYDDVYRIRVVRYRILYSVSGKKLVVIFLKIGHRKEVYR